MPEFPGRRKQADIVQGPGYYEGTQASQDERVGDRFRLRGSIYGAVLASMLVNGWQQKRLRELVNQLKHVDDRKALMMTMGMPKGLPVYKVPGYGNAAYYHPGGVPDELHGQRLSPQTVERIRRLGAILYDPTYASPGILAHEAGHADIRLNNPWYSPSRINQSVLRPISGFANALLPAGVGAVAGLASHSPMVGAGVGLGLGALTSLPTLINEGQATGRAKKYLRQAVTDPHELQQNIKALRDAGRTYSVAGMLPGVLAGAIGGGLGMMKGGHWLYDVARETRNAARS